MKRPYMICHLLTSADGRISGRYFNYAGSVFAAYGKIRSDFGADGYVYGAVTADELFVHGKKPVPEKVMDREVLDQDFISNDAERCVFVLDPEGTLGFADSFVEREGLGRCRVIEILGTDAGREARSYYREKGIAYMIVKDLQEAMQKAARDYHMEKLVILGGGGADTAFAKEDLIDELSLVVAPVLDLGPGALLTRPAAGCGPVPFSHLDVKKTGDAGVWLDYRR